MTNRIYLAGGFHSEWQSKVKDALQSRDFEFYDPSEHDLKDPHNYTSWDLNAVRSCDIVFAFMERLNPGGYATALEVGYAVALGKTIVFVDDFGPEDGQKSRYFEMVRQVSDYKFNGLGLALDFMLKTFPR